MNEYQKKKICELRSGGYGYKAIAKEVGISRDIVRNFCKKNRLNGNLSQMDNKIRKMVIETTLCAQCSTPIQQKKRGKARRFCSDECRRTWWKENSSKGQKKDTALYKCVCGYCKTEFESYGNKHRKYCCHDCYIKDRFGS